MKKKLICILLTVVPISIVFLVYMILKSISFNVYYTKIDKDNKNYNNYRMSINGADDLLPDFPNICQENYLFAYKKTYRKNFFDNIEKTNFNSSYDCISVFVTYEIDEYNQVKNNLNDKNSINELVETSIKGKKYYVFPTFEFEYKNYYFKIYLNETYASFNQITSQSFMMVGFDDFNYKICYLYYFNYNSLYLCDSKMDESKYNNVMIKLIKKYFYWYD